MRRLALLLTVFCAAAALAQAPSPQPPITLLQRNIERIAGGVHADWGIYIKSLDTGEEVTLNPNAVMDTMSTIKIPILVDAFRQVDAGKLHLDDRMTMQHADKRFGTGVLRTMDDPLPLTFKDVLTLMIIQSDNTATDLAFGRVGGPQHVTGLMREMGFEKITATGTAFEWFRALGAISDPAWSQLTPAELFDKGYPQVPTRAKDIERFETEDKTPFGLTTPRQMGQLLEKIARNEAASQDSCQKMLGILRMQQMNTRIPKYVQASTPHKTGDFPPYIANDVGYIETPRTRVVIAVFTAHHRGIYANLEDAIGRIAEETWLYFNARAPQPPSPAARP